MFSFCREIVAEKEVEKPEVTETEEPVEETEKTEKKEKNGDAEESKPENGVEDKCALKNGNVKQNGFAAEKEESESNESAGMMKFENITFPLLNRSVYYAFLNRYISCTCSEFGVNLFHYDFQKVTKSVELRGNQSVWKVLKPK